MWRSMFLFVFLLGGKGDPELSPTYVDHFLAEPRSSTGNLILEGTITDLGKMQEVCLTSAPQVVTFRINRLLWGGWPNPTIQIGYGGCQIPLPSPPFTKGARLIVFARALEPQRSDSPVRGNEKNIVGTGVRWGLFPATDENIHLVLQAIANRPAQRR